MSSEILLGTTVYQGGLQAHWSRAVQRPGPRELHGPCAPWWATSGIVSKADVGGAFGAPIQ
eukprot:6474358-Amphidinium_carterae.1